LAKLIFFGIMSLDGYYEDANGSFLFGRPDDEVFEFSVELERSIGTSLYGRRMYETMVYWDTLEDLASLPSHLVSSRSCGGRETRSSTRRRWTTSRPQRRVLSASSTQRRSKR
jgi:hypothetical protein